MRDIVNAIFQVRGSHRTFVDGTLCHVEYITLTDRLSRREAIPQLVERVKFMFGADAYLAAARSGPLEWKKLAAQPSSNERGQPRRQTMKIGHVCLIKD